MSNYINGVPTLVPIRTEPRPGSKLVSGNIIWTVLEVHGDWVVASPPNPEVTERFHWNTGFTVSLFDGFTHYALHPSDWKRVFTENYEISTEPFEFTLHECPSDEPNFPLEMAGKRLIAHLKQACQELSIWVHEGKGHYIGSTVVVVHEKKEDAQAQVRLILDSMGLTDEKVSLVKHQIFPSNVIIKQSGDY